MAIKDKKGLTFIEICVCIVILVGLVFLVRGCVGCMGYGSKYPPLVPKKQFLDSQPSSKDTVESTVDRGVLLGKWELLTGHWKGSTIEMTPGGSLHIGLKGPYSKDFDDKYGRFSFNNAVVTVGPENGPSNTYRVEAHSDDEMTLTEVSSTTYMGFEQLVGRWKRLGERQGVPGPIADAKQQVHRIEQKIAKLESILQTTLSDRDDLAAKLRSVGVRTSADLKNNQRGMRLAENAVKLAGEIESLERQLSDIDAELLKAKSIVRRMEREQAGLSDQEMTSLAIQLREAEERMDGTPLPVTPLDIDTAIQRALKGSVNK